jgi:hypothetical protein
MDEMWQVTQLQHEHTKLVSLVASLWDTFVQSQMGQKKISANVASSDVNGVDELQTRINRAEREIADLRQQQLLLATEKQDETAELSNILSELTSLKQRLAKALSSATEQLTTMEQASVPTQIQKDIAQLVVESNWMYATIISHNPLHYFASPSRSDQPVGSFSPGERILVFAKPLQTTSEGEWMQTRIGSDPDKRFWVQTVDLPSRRATLGHFDVCYRTNK